MEEEENIQQWDMENNQGITQIISIKRHAINQDQISSIIHQLIALNRPIFKVVSTTNIIKKELIQQELIKQKILSYNRKEKSLQELSKKFISNFQGKDGIILELDKVTIQLKVERRRIYDIVNIFQSLDVVKKAAKNNYIWRGLKQAIKTINMIQQNGSDFSLPSGKKQKSLQSLSSRFLQLFVCSKNPLSLQESAKQLIQNQDSSLVKTKIRRLYDIVNVFKSIGIVQKIHLASNKPAFKWVGTKVLQKIITEQKFKYSNQVNERMGCIIEKQNSLNMPNKQNMKEMIAQEDKKALIELSFKKKFSQKMFEPEIIRQQTVSYSLTATQQNLNDICAYY